MLNIVIAALLAAQAPATGTIAGTVRYVGVVPPDERVTLTDGQVILHNDVVVHPKSKGLRHVAVVLDWKTKVPADANAKPVLIDQRDLQFLPRVVTVQEGVKVRFENNDAFNHGVSAESIHPENTFNLTTPAGQPYEHKFKAQKNPIPIGCSLHRWMRAYVFVAPHPYHAVTSADGKFMIERAARQTHVALGASRYELSRHDNDRGSGGNDNGRGGGVEETEVIPLRLALGWRHPSAKRRETHWPDTGTVVGRFR